MSKKPRLISPKLLVLLLIVLGGSVYTFWQGRLADEATTVPVKTAAIKQPSSAHKRPSPAPDSVFVNLFTTPPPPPAPPPSLEQKPSAPPLPFQLESTWQMGAETVLALRMNGALYLVCQRCKITDAVHPGGTIAGQYQLKAIGDDAIDFIYLPLAEPQQLALNGLK